MPKTATAIFTEHFENHHQLLHHCLLLQLDAPPTATHAVGNTYCVR